MAGEDYHIKDELRQIMLSRGFKPLHIAAIMNSLTEIMTSNDAPEFTRQIQKWNALGMRPGESS